MVLGGSGGAVVFVKDAAQPALIKTKPAARKNKGSGTEQPFLAPRLAKQFLKELLCLAYVANKRVLFIVIC